MVFWCTCAGVLTAVISDQSGSLLKSNLQVDLNHLYHWFSCNGLVLSQTKTVAINFHSNYKTSKNINYNIFYIINQSLATMFLGLMVDESLAWAIHMDILENELNKAFYVILILCGVVKVNILLSVYYTCVCSNINHMWYYILGGVQICATGSCTEKNCPSYGWR